MRCNTTMHRGGTCVLDNDHHGRHTTSAFYCDACGKMRRGQPSAVEEVRLGDGTLDDRFYFCFLCVTGKGQS